MLGREFHPGGIQAMNSETPETMAWLCALRGGKPAALAELYEHYRPRLRQMVRLRMDPRLAARVDPSDVLQEAFVDAARQVSNYLKDPQVVFYVWLRGLAWKRLLKLQREHLGAQRRAVSREVALPGNSSIRLGQQLLAQGSSPSKAMMQRELQQRVRHAMAGLPPEDREVILLRKFEAMSNIEVAQALGLSEAAASMRYGRAIYRLKEVLTAQESQRDSRS
jgi:RNA polymerase sigma-70 factor (ECF subfamily)